MTAIISIHSTSLRGKPKPIGAAAVLKVMEADAFGRRKSMIIITTMIILFALFAFKPLLGSGNPLLVIGERGAGITYFRREQLRQQRAHRAEG
jgi:hypothetical protein